MIKLMRDVIKRDEGFTLIELLVVIVILGILSAIVIPNITGFRNTASVETAKASLQTIRLGIESYNISNDEYPSSDIAKDGWSGSVLDDYIDSGKIDDSNIEYVYTAPTDSDGYKVVATLPNGDTITLTESGIEE